MSLRQIASNSFYQLIVIYSLLVLVVSLSFFSEFTYHFEIFALILGILGFISLAKRPSGKLNPKVKACLIILSILLIILTRTIPYLDNQIPLGYDAGLYKYAMDSGLENQDSWILRGGMEPGFLYLMTPLTYIFSSDFLLTYGFIFFILLLGLVLYFTTREYFGELSASIAFLIYALSPAQFLMFTYMYYKNAIGLILLLLSALFLARYEKTTNLKYMILAIISAGILGSIHRPTFYIFGISYFLYALIQPYKNKEYNWKKLRTNIIFGIIILAIAGFFYLGDFSPAVTSIISPVISSFTSPGESPGTFIDLTAYQFIILAYLPFSLLGLFLALKSRKLVFLSIWAIANAIIVIFQFFFFNRFIIHLDIAAIIFAGLGFSALIEKRKKLGLIVMAILMVSLAVISFQQSLDAEPVISPQSLDLIKQIPELTEEKAYVMSITKQYSPWILAYSERKTIAPGLFDYDLWEYEEWEEFWSSPSKERTTELMKEYEKPIYLFAGTRNYNNSCFSVFAEENGNRLLRYEC
ncbi:hypothetical protein CO038_00765 [Candidatus Pacearchaeota archaeon CG_4_9_14_0_2_um_filter_39_13]|nr:MAG: hypothetical protein CO038_00765 [Candidatus Pacearchaeota archaeon CG_4_9_14_0_2_um_filter_39_13]